MYQSGEFESSHTSSFAVADTASAKAAPLFNGSQNSSPKSTNRRQNTTTEVSLYKKYVDRQIGIIQCNMKAISEIARRDSKVAHSMCRIRDAVASVTSKPENFETVNTWNNEWAELARVIRIHLPLVFSSSSGNGLEETELSNRRRTGAPQHNPL